MRRLSSSGDPSAAAQEATGFSENVCGIPQSMFRVSRSLLEGCLVLLVVVFLCIIPLICCAPVLGRGEAQPCVSFSCRSGSAYVCAARQRESVGRLSLLFAATAAAAVECPIQESWLCLIIIPFLIYIFSSFAAWFAALALWRLASGGRGAARLGSPCCAALIFTGRGHYQLIDYFDCCYLIPHTVL